MLVGVLLAGLMVAGCGRGDSLPDDQRTRKAQREVLQRWGKSLEDLPVRGLVIISPHNENIRREFEWAFSLHHAVEFGQRVRFEWRSVGGGASSIDKFLTNVYGASDSSGIDVVWGGGDQVFSGLAREGILQPMQLGPEVLEQIPLTLKGIPFRDENMLWAGAAISAFGYLYNRDMISRCGIDPPDGTWDDLADRRFSDLLCLADPTQSGSAAAAYLLIASSGKDWPEGWAKLIRLISNAKRFVDSAGSAANAPVLGESLIATCIDFYGIVRVAEAPDKLTYVSPRGQTAFTPDPIGILKNPPDERLAQRFVDFVLSQRGQALLALKVGKDHGPVSYALCRQPVRKDVYQLYAQDMLDAIVNPYQEGQAMDMQGHRSRISFGVLRQLVRTAAIDNLDDLRDARAYIIKAGSPEHLLAEFVSLPENVNTLEKMEAISADMADEVTRERILTEWTRFFAIKYRRIIAGEVVSSGPACQQQEKAG